MIDPKQGRATNRFKEFVEYVGRPCNVQSDLKWEIIKAFLQRIPTALERVDFLEELKKLPDDGIVDNTVKNPQRHQKNLREIMRPLQSECSRLLLQHFDIETVLNRAKQIADHGKALTYLWNVKNDYREYHPTIKRGSFSPEELSFWNDINTEIQYRKDLQDSLAKSSTMNNGNAFAPSESQERAYEGNPVERDSAQRLYQRVKNLVRGYQPLNQEKAKLIIELAEDAIKEFGNTNQERKVELRQIGEWAQEFLPPKTIQELRERVQKQGLRWWPWQNKKLRSVIYVLVALIGITCGFLAIRGMFSGTSNSINIRPTSNPLASPQPASTPSPPASPVPAPSPSASIRPVSPRMVKAPSNRRRISEPPCSSRDRALGKC